MTSISNDFHALFLESNNSIYYNTVGVWCHPREFPTHFVQVQKPEMSRCDHVDDYGNHSMGKTLNFEATASLVQPLPLGFSFVLLLFLGFCFLCASFYFAATFFSPPFIVLRLSLRFHFLHFNLFALQLFFLSHLLRFCLLRSSFFAFPLFQLSPFLRYRFLFQNISVLINFPFSHCRRTACASYWTDFKGLQRRCKVRR